MNAFTLPIQMLGQSGVKLLFDNITVLVDPYLSNSVQENIDSNLIREIPIPILPGEIGNIDFIFITHDHLDHCDPETLTQIYLKSSKTSFIGPKRVIDVLSLNGINNSNLILASEDWVDINPTLRWKAIPAAHPKIQRDQNGNLDTVGYLIEYLEEFIYFAGDTFVNQEIINIIKSIGKINTAFLPVNEHNFFRSKMGILGNMSVREAFQFADEIDAKQVVPVHWDMFSVNNVFPDEIELIFSKLKYNFSLLINPSFLALKKPKVSIIIRTLNEDKYLESLLNSIENQKIELSATYEVIIVDSGSIDKTLEIAHRRNCRIIKISRDDFSFGRSLNLGCSVAAGDIFVIISGHCVPYDNSWLQNLCNPIINKKTKITYGRQIAGKSSHFSESQIFLKYYPEKNKFSEISFFCNNANAAIDRNTWQNLRYDEEITGLEDMELAKRFSMDGKKIIYVNDAIVFHYHNENWSQIMRRFEREAIALQKIMPQLHFNLIDFIYFYISSVLLDFIAAFKKNILFDAAFDILRYRWFQYLGVYKGNHFHRALSKKEKDIYFYPN
jgi:L-ascorbate metabolism protein UlaG (beta-lactamase superfamily)/glycosyltransferase involved in cell wall biosynthesis